MANRDRAIIYYLSLMGFFGIFSTTISKSPVLPLFTHSLGASESTLGLISAFSPLAGILFSFPIGYLSDRWDRKKILILSAAVFLAAPLLYLLVTQPVYLIPIRFFHGIATAILGPIASAIIVSTYEKSKGEKIGLYSSATLIGRTLAPLLGGVVISYFAYLGGIANFRLVYVVAFLLAIPVFLIALFFPSDDRPATDHSAEKASGILRALADFVTNQKLLATSLAEMATYFCYGVMETYLPLYLSSHGVPASKIGLIFSLQILSIALTKPAFGRLADRFDKRWQILIGLSAIAFSIALVPLFVNYYIIVVLGLIFGIGISFGTVATSTYTAEVADKSLLGASLGALSSIMDIGQSFGPLIVGFVITAFSLELGFLTSAVLSVLVIIFFASTVFRSQPD